MSAQNIYSRILPLIDFSEQKFLYDRSKRLIDVIVSVICFVALLPVFVITAILIKLDSNGPILYKQQRVGRDGCTFYCWKFRSMCLDADKEKEVLASKNEMDGGVLFKIKSDPRVTRVGKVIRPLSIDELPQLWNVLKGDMSLVGPRPPIPTEVALYNGHQMKRLSVTPGITCIWQVSGRSDVPFEKQVEMDLNYINSRSLLFDVKLMLLTIPAVLSRKGAY